MPALTHEAVKRLYQKALEGGADRPSIMSADWDAAGSCESPVPIERFARPSPKIGEKHIRVDNATKIPYLVRMHVPCRKCRKCLSYRAKVWRERATAEVAYWPRTWFGTLTLRPEEHYRALCAAKGASFEARHEVIGKWITLFLKRIRKNSGAKFRYLLVAESHEGGGELHGLPHYHMLVCEVLGQVTHKVLTEAWEHGFTNFKLVDNSGPAPTYICKYLAKDARARVRASGGFGRPEKAAFDCLKHIHSIEKIDHQKTPSGGCGTEQEIGK